jgi:hypothetical protein
VALVRVDVSEEISPHQHGDNNVFRLLVTSNVVPSSPILLALMMKAMYSFRTSFLIRVTRRNFPEDGILHRTFLFACGCFHWVSRLDNTVTGLA